MAKQVHTEYFAEKFKNFDPDESMLQKRVDGIKTMLKFMDKELAKNGTINSDDAKLFKTTVDSLVRDARAYQMLAEDVVSTFK